MQEMDRVRKRDGRKRRNTVWWQSCRHCVCTCIRRQINHKAASYSIKMLMQENVGISIYLQYIPEPKDCYYAKCMLDAGCNVKTNLAKKNNKIKSLLSNPIMGRQKTWYKPKTISFMKMEDSQYFLKPVTQWWAPTWKRYEIMFLWRSWNTFIRDLCLGLMLAWLSRVWCEKLKIDDVRQNHRAIRHPQWLKHNLMPWVDAVADKVRWKHFWCRTFF